jgi:hypothetical protein
MMENQIEIYQSPDGIIFNVQLSNETFWLSQDQLTVLFEKDQSVISRHLINVFKEGELVKESNMQKCIFLILISQLLFIIWMSSFLLGIE